MPSPTCMDEQVIAMDAEEAERRGIEDLGGLEAQMPGMAQAIHTFFRVYKVGVRWGMDEGEVGLGE